MPSNTPTTTLNWMPGGARGGSIDWLEDGEQYLMAVRCCHSPEAKKRYSPPFCDHEWWDMAVVSVSYDSETPVSLSCDGNGWGWEWDHVDWFVPIDAIQLPFEETTDAE